MPRTSVGRAGRMVMSAWVTALLCPLSLAGRDLRVPVGGDPRVVVSEQPDGRGLIDDQIGNHLRPQRPEHGGNLAFSGNDAHTLGDRLQFLWRRTGGPLVECNVSVGAVLPQEHGAHVPDHAFVA